MVPSDSSAREIVTTSAWCVTSLSWVTRLMDSATITPSRQMTAPYGYSPAFPDAFAMLMQCVIINWSNSSAITGPHELTTVLQFTIARHIGVRFPFREPQSVLWIALSSGPFRAEARGQRDPARANPARGHRRD